jgi:hypothetical protein
MRVTAHILAAAMLAATATFAHGDRIAKQIGLCDLSQASGSLFTRRNTTVLGITKPVGGPLASLSFGGNLASFGQDFSSAHDWSAYNIVDMVLTDKGTTPLNFKYIVQFKSDSGDYTNAYIGNFWINPGSPVHVTCFLNQDDPSPYGFEFLNPVLSAFSVEVFNGGKHPLNTTWRWRLSYQGTNTAKVDLTQMRLLRQSLDFTGICDAYGQYTDRSWATKVLSQSDFSARKSAESTDLAAHPGTNEMTGTTKVTNPSPQLNKWAVITNSNGSKYLQHPNGKLFWSVGLNGINDSLATPVQGRTNYFAPLPSSSGTYASCYSTMGTSMGTKLSYSFRKQNLMMKYGSSYKTPWLANLKLRLQSWGINTVGIDSTNDLLNTYIPFTMDVDTNGFGTRLKAPQQKWGSLPDPYSSSFLSWCQSSFKSQLASYVGNTNLMGVYVDNELSWGSMESTVDRYNVALGALVAPSTQPAKTALISILTTHYGTITNLNTAWKTSFSSWSALTSNTTWKPTTYTSSMIGDFYNFDTQFAAKYSSQVRSALQSAGLKSLYLGCRFADYTDEVVAGVSPNVDILSFNIYRFYYDIPWTYFAGLKKPVVFSEFGYTMRAWGTFGGPAVMASSVGRSNALKQLLDSAIAQKNIVGVSYYCYADQPITGRWSDYENGGFGLTDVTDVPYADSINVLRNFTASMYTTHATASNVATGLPQARAISAAP